MKLTNKHNLPQPLVNLAEKRLYTRGKSDISATQIIDSPRVVVMRQAHEPDIVEDVADGLWALMGTMFHKVAEEGADENHLAEQRLFLEVEGWTISGGIDIQLRGKNSCTIADWKFTSDWAVNNFEKNKWADQLDVYAHLVREVKGWNVDGAQIWAFIRNWDYHKTKRDQNYPKIQFKRIDIPLRSPEEAKEFVISRVKMHQAADLDYTLGAKLPLCTDEDRWAKKGRWYAKKPENKRPSYWGDTKEEVERKLNGKEGYDIVFEEGEMTRCQRNFCGVAQYCDQFNG